MNNKKACIIIPLVISVLIKWLVSLWGYSGQGKPPMYGDFEAQRHWLEVTTSLPICEWYKNTTNNNLMYWGLDYPPLTAYISWIFGIIARYVVSPLVELDKSRGYEQMDGKIFMRISVIISDLTTYSYPIVLYNNLLNNISEVKNKNILIQSALLLLIYLINPSIILIDNGHFQYNCVCIGLTLLGSYSILYDYDTLGSIFFVLALNFKQMTLYYSLVFFCVLLKKCFDVFHKKGLISFVVKLSTIGLTVISVFTVLWLPFCIYHDSNDTCLSGLQHVLIRLFPFSRGIFEDKVANIWYGLSVLYDYRNVWSLDRLKLLSILLTLTLCLPTSIYNLFYPITTEKFLISLMNSSLSFFLASFQVHEKSLLLSLIPASLLFRLDPVIMVWYQILGSFSMYPLLLKDELKIPFYVINFIYMIIISIYYEFDKTIVKSPTNLIERAKLILVTLSYTGMIILLLSESFLKPPNRYPDLYPALFSLYSLINLLLMYIFGNIYLYN